MIVIEHRPLEIVLFLVALLVGSITIFRSLRSRRKALRLPLQAGAVLFAVASGVLLLFDGCGELLTETEASHPIYSPDQRHAIVVRDWDAGALGGSTYFDLYSYGGIREQEIGGGDFKIVTASDVRWTSNQELQLTYSLSYGTKPICQSTTTIRVTCVPGP